jgi:hypothetical protein
VRVAVILTLFGLFAASVLPDGQATAATMVQGGFTTSASVSGTNFSPGGAVGITARVTSATARTMRVEVEVYSPTAARLDQIIFDNELLPEGTQRTFPVTWNVPAGAVTGGYTVKVGVSGAGGGLSFHRNDSAAFFTVGMGSPPPAGGPIRIMPLGDSLTDGFTVEGGYRIELSTLLASANHSVDFVGSRYGGVPALVDKNHEGHPGMRIDQLAEDLTAWLLAYRPQIVLLLVGTQDMLQNHDVQGASSRLSSLIDQIRAAVPDAAIVVSSLPRNSDVVVLGRIQDFNAQIPGIVASKGSAVSYVDAYVAIEAGHLGPDGTHLTANGYVKLASVWYPTVHAILNVLAPPPSPTATATATVAPTPSLCEPRPRVIVSTVKSPPNRLTATISVTGTGNSLKELRFGEVKNATVTVGN